MIIKEKGFSLSLLGHISFRSLQRVQFEIIFFNFLLDVSGEIAGSLCPLHRRLTIGLAVGTSLVIHHSVTPFAGLDDGIASSPVVGTTRLLHEDALCSHLDSLTNHGNQPPFLLNLFSKTN